MAPPDGIVVAKMDDLDSGVKGVGPHYYELVVRTTDLERAHQILKER
jgi:hypothetical protein